MQLILPLLLSLLLLPLVVSCTPVGGQSGVGSRTDEGGGAPLARVTFPETRSPTVVPTAEEQRELRERRAQLASGSRPLGEQAGVRGRQPDGLGNTGSAEEPSVNPLPPLDVDYRYAMRVPGREGWVYNPYTNSPVNVKAAASGYLVYDERDPANRNPDGTLKPVSEMPHKFRVP